MRSVFAIVFLVALVMFAAGSASADVRILASPGGQIGPYLRLFSAMQESGERVVIDGPCLSACTLVLMTLPRQRIRVKAASASVTSLRMISLTERISLIPPAV